MKRKKEPRGQDGEEEQAVEAAGQSPEEEHVPAEPTEAIPTEEPVTVQAAGAEAQPEPAAETGVEPAAAGRPGGARIRYLLTAAVSAGVLVFALAFFMAGFAAHALLEDGGGGGGGGGEVASDNSADDATRGPEDAPVVIQEFADFQCPYCARFATQTLPQIKNTYADQIRFVFRDFPLTNMHQFAQKAAEAAQCAQEQDRFWEYHDLLFENQSALSIPDLKRYAEQVGMDTAKFNDCLDSGKNAGEVMLDIQDGNRAGVTGTPAFLVNGLLVTGAQPFEQFQRIIDQALAATD